LIAAPTGSGKTLAAFLVAIDRLVREGLEPGKFLSSCSVLYVSPLKALGNDIQRNLQAPLSGIGEELHALGLPAVAIKVAVRTGDTPQAERQAMLKHPPHILVTTPESLYLLLTSKGGRQLLRGVRSVIVDEIHAMLGDKRGSHLSLSLERLAMLVQAPLQRIGLSATQKPIARVAQYLVGLGNVREGKADCVIVDSGHRRQLDLRVAVPSSPLSALMSNEVWAELYQQIEQLIQNNRTTLIFVNTRRLAERMALSLSERLGVEQVSSHHGSMSKEHRFDAEQRLKQGQLKVLVATASMELGIDIGAVDLVIQVSSPKSIATFLQRVGRSGHYVGGVPKGVLFPLTRDDLVECTALIAALGRGELDQLVIPDKPLDILAQQLIAELGSREDDEQGVAVDDLWHWVRQSWVYRDLERAEFDALLQMLNEGYTTRRGRAGAWLYFDQINQKLRPRRGARLVALTNGGAIPDMFDYQVVLDPEDIVVGTLNEDFALEALPGDVFTLGNHGWRLLGIDGLKVRVTDAQGQPPTVPFWLGEGVGRTRELSEAVSCLRASLAVCFETSLQHGIDWLQQQEVGLDYAAAEQLAAYLYVGYKALGVMPTRDTLVMERFFDEVGDMHLVLHTPFGSRVNKAWGLALRKRFCRSFNFELQAAANDDSIVISLGAVHSFELHEVFGYLHSASVREVLIQALLDAPMFEVRWRHNASRALAVQRNRGGKRIPPQFQRMAAEDFVAQVFPDQIACLENLSGPRAVPTHPLVQQTIHDCLTEAMDIEELERIVCGIESGSFTLIAKDLREPSPFAQEIINARPYAFLDDAPFEERRTLAVRHRTWCDPMEAADYSTLDPAAIARVCDEAWPWIRNSEELHDALLLLGFMTLPELHGNDAQADASLYLDTLVREGRATRVSRGKHSLWIASERWPLFAALPGNWQCKPAVALPPHLAQRIEPDTALVELLRGRLEALGPVTAQVLAAPLGMNKSEVMPMLLHLEAEGFAFQGHYSPHDGRAPDDKEWCERRLLQRIHRYTLDAHRESIKPVSLQVYMQTLFELHDLQALSDERVISGVATQEMLRRVLTQLDGVTAPAAAWEGDMLPARLPHYDPLWLDQLCSSGQVCWGRLLQPKEGGEGRKAGPVKSAPLNLVQRANLDLWVALGCASRSIGCASRSMGCANAEPQGLSSAAQALRQCLHQKGASFYSDLCRYSGLLPVQVAEALAELVSAGLVTSDNYTGLRALLTPTSHKPKREHRERRRALYGIEDAGRWALLTQDSGVADECLAEALTDAQLNRLIQLYCKRWGVLARAVLENESVAPPWRVLLRHLRLMELRGEIRGGRFINGVGGEQFAMAETVALLRRKQKEWHEQQASVERKPLRHVINATDPLNLLGTLLPDKRVPHLHNNRILFEDGLPIAVLEKEQVHYLRNVSEAQQWEVQRLLQKRSFPPRLRAYLGRV
jgi:ATP-dependent Lhr-like helicase